MPTTTKSHPRRRPSFCDDVRHPPCSFEGGDGVLEDGADTVSAMKVGDGLADRLAEHAEERRLRWVNGDHVQAFLPERSRDFRADEPHADDDDSATSHHLFPYAIGILDRTKTINAFKIAPGNRDAPVAPARGDEQRVERHATMILELHESL